MTSLDPLSSPSSCAPLLAKMSFDLYLEKCFMCQDDVEITPQTIKQIYTFTGCRDAACRPCGLHVCGECKEGLLQSISDGDTPCPQCKKKITVQMIFALLCFELILMYVSTWILA
jgi:hypothetical protein